jgi:hypothetical protein
MEAGTCFGFYGDQTLSICLINCIITAVKNQKKAKMNKRTASVVIAVAATGSKTGGKTIKAAYSKKALARSVAIFKPKKVHIVVPALVSSLE